MKIALDLDGTITRYPEFFATLSQLWDDDVYVITFRDSMETSVADCRRYGVKYKEIILANKDDDTKAIEIERLGIGVFFDDMPEFLIHTKKNVATFLVRNEENFDYADKQFLFSKYTGREIDKRILMKRKIDNFIVQAGSLGRVPSVDMNPAYSGGLLLLPGFEFPVVIDLAPLAGTEHEQNIPILRNHDPNREIGHTERITIDGNAVNIEGKLSFDNADVTDIVKTNKAGKRWQVSVGSGSVPASMQQFVSEGEKVTINGQVQTGPLIIVRTPIREVSFVPAGADLHNSVTIHASTLQGENIMKTFEEWAQEMGFDLSTIDDSNKAALQKIYEAEVAAEPVEANATGDDKDKPEEKPVQASAMRRSNLGTASVGASPRVGAIPVIEASLLMSGGVSDTEIEKLGYDHRTIDQAVSRENRGMGLQSLFHACIAAAGMHYPGGRADNGLIETAFEASKRLRQRGVHASGMSAGSFSTINLPGILSNVANKTLLNAYRRIESAALQISHIATASDFKEMSHYQFEVGGSLQVVHQVGELEHVTLKETEYKNRIQTRGAIVALTRQMIVNDDLEAFLRIPQEFGRKAAQTLEYVTFTTLLKNLNILFTTDNGNSTTKKLSISGLDVASKIFGEQKDKSGSFTLIQPSLLLVPPALAAVAKALNTSTTVNETTPTGKPSPVDNPWTGSFKPVVSPFMGGSFTFDVDGENYTGDDNQWILLADPLDLAILQIAFLNGQRNPIIESGEMDFNTLGMAWRCYFDFGVGLLDPRAGVYSDGSAI